jgi:hypothetical protein
MDKRPDADLLERMAEANEQASDYINNGNMPNAMPAPPPLVSAMFKAMAMTQRRLAKDTREGKPLNERVATDG